MRGNGLIKRKKKTFDIKGKRKFLSCGHKEELIIRGGKLGTSYDGAAAVQGSLPLKGRYVTLTTRPLGDLRMQWVQELMSHFNEKNRHTLP